MHDFGGTYRAIDPKATLAKIEPLLWSKFGISRTANVTGLDNINIPTYVAIRPLSKMLTTSQGKGITHDLAKVSAIMEAIEGWHGERIPPPTLIGAQCDLKNTHALINLESVYNGNFSFQERMLDKRPFSWLKGLELNSGREIYFPSALINLDFVFSHRTLEYFAGSSNGLASGNTYEEAVCHGLYEVIERDCWAKSELQPKRKVDLATITSPHLKDLIMHLNSRSVHLQIEDITNEINVPAFTATISDLTGIQAVGHFSGAGAHFSSVVALSRAITEAIQSRLTCISGTRDDVYPQVYRSIRTSSLAALDKPSHQNDFLSEGETWHAFTETAVPSDFTLCIDKLLNQLKRAGYHQVIVYNHTKPDIGIPVVHVLVPGLQFDICKHLNQAYFPDQL